MRTKKKIGKVNVKAMQEQLNQVDNLVIEPKLKKKKKSKKKIISNNLTINKE